MIKKCCQNQENLKIVDSGKKDLTLRVCTICNCRHFELNASPGIFGLKGKGL